MGPCLHHTGNMRLAIAVCHRLLVPGGRFIGMAYYAFSHRQWWNERVRTLRHLKEELGGNLRTVREVRRLPTIIHRTDRWHRRLNLFRSGRCGLFAASSRSSAHERKTQTASRHFGACQGDGSFVRQCHVCVALIFIGPA
jgi:hypothetical protein